MEFADFAYDSAILQDEHPFASSQSGSLCVRVSRLLAWPTRTSDEEENEDNWKNNGRRASSYCIRPIDIEWLRYMQQEIILKLQWGYACEITFGLKSNIGSS